MSGDQSQDLLNLAAAIGVDECQDFNSTLVARVESLSRCVPYREFCFGPGETQAALDVLKISFTGSLTIYGFERNKMHPDLEVELPEHKEEPPLIVSCSASELPSLLDWLTEDHWHWSFIVSDKKMSPFLYIHSDGIVGEFKGSDLFH